jgi:transcriptional regulator of acetoin/glycerol metabolism
MPGGVPGGLLLVAADAQLSLLQSELFGHDKGAFTGADRARAGLFEVADGGTIFLEEIGEISQATQVNRLRGWTRPPSVTWEGPGRSPSTCGSSPPRTATCKEMVRQGLLREDLFYRLSTITVLVPALRDRPEDVELRIPKMERAQFGHNRPRRVRKSLNLQGSLAEAGGNRTARSLAKGPRARQKRQK